MARECPARLSFPTAPYLDLQCTEPPGHHPGTLHRVKVHVRVALVPYDVHARFDTMNPHPSVTREPVFMQWAQDVDPPEEPT